MTAPVSYRGGRLFSVHVFHDPRGGLLEDLGVLEDIAPCLEGLGPVVAVGGALVDGKLAVDVLVVDHVAVAVQLVGVALGAEGDEHRQGAEVVDVVEDRADAQGAKIRDDQRAVEGACLQQALGQQVKVVQDAQDLDDKAQQEARQARQGRRPHPRCCCSPRWP